MIQAENFLSSPGCFERQASGHSVFFGNPISASEEKQTAKLKKNKIKAQND